jgi:hypothetical protein
MPMAPSERDDMNILAEFLLLSSAGKSSLQQLCAFPKLPLTVIPHALPGNPLHVSILLSQLVRDKAVVRVESGSLSYKIPSC